MIVNDLLQSLGRPNFFFLWSSMICCKASVAQMCFLFVFYDRQRSLTKPRSPKYVSYLDSMIVNDLLQSLGRTKMCLTEIQWSSMISYKSLVAQICVLFRFNDRQWSPTKPRSPKYVPFFRLYHRQWSLTKPRSVAQKCFLFDLYDRQWSLTKPRSPKYVSYLDSMIVNDLLQILGRPTNVFIWSLWSSMISYKASVAQICVLFRLNDRQWSLTKPRSPKYVSHMALYDREWSFIKPRSPKYVSYLDSMIVNNLLQCLSRRNLCLIWTQWSSMFF